MSRSQRVLPAHTPAHLVQRAVERRLLFHGINDFEGFIDVLTEAAPKYPIKLLGYCVMPNHWHLLASSETTDAISGYMQWITSTHAMRHRRTHGTIGHGHVYQDRFWSAPIEDEEHFFNVLRYVEANARRAKLVERAEEWRWSSAWERTTGRRALLATLPAPLPNSWNDVLNATLQSVSAES